MDSFRFLFNFEGFEATGAFITCVVHSSHGGPEPNNLKYDDTRGIEVSSWVYEKAYHRLTYLVGMRLRLCKCVCVFFFLGRLGAHDLASVWPLVF